MPDAYCLTCLDYKGREVVFEEKNRIKHIEKHKELADLINFVQTDVSQALMDPDCVYRSINDPENVHVYCRVGIPLDPYDDKYSHRFVKVFVFVPPGGSLVVKTAYQLPAPRPHEAVRSAERLYKRSGCEKCHIC